MRSGLLFVSFALICQSQLAIGAERPKRPPPAVTAYTVEAKQIPQNYISSGTLAAYQQAELHTELSGRIAKLYVSAGDFVEVGDPLVKLDTRSAQAELDRLQSQLNLAEQQLERQRSLVKNMAGAAEKVDIQEAEVAGLRSNIRIARLALERHEISAPFSGVLGNFDWVEGGWINSNEAFATLDNVTQLKVNFDLPERYLRHIELGREIELSSAAWPEQIFTGNISLIDARMNAQRATLGVQAVIDNQQGLLRPGMRVSVLLRVDTGQAKLVVPARTLIHEGERTTVLKIDADSKTKSTEVKLGQETSERVEVTEGLAVGDRIVDRGLVKAKPNSPVSILGEGGGGDRNKEGQRREKPQS